jgi:hypothetical protein
MEMNLAPFMGGLFDWVLFGFVIGPSLCVVLASWLNHWIVKREFLGARDVLQMWSRVALDSILVMGILGTTIGIQGMIFYSEMNLDASRTYSNVRIALLTFTWGGIIAGVAFAVRDKNHEIELKFPLWGLLLALLFTCWMVTIQLGETGTPIIGGFLNQTGLIIYAAIFLSCAVPAFLQKTDKSFLLIAIESNLTAALGGAAVGICYWFFEGGDYIGSLDAIFLTANIIFMGCANYLFLYFLSLYFNKREDGDFQIKTWHFAEAASFFIFLVYAPVGTTEFMREASDQASIQAQHEAQEIRIEQLEAQIRLLTANQKS